jgi:hypothetical protein
MGFYILFRPLDPPGAGLGVEKKRLHLVITITLPNYGKGVNKKIFLEMACLGIEILVSI